MSYLGNTPDTATYYTIGIDRFSGTGACTQFTMSRTVAHEQDIEVLVDGSQLIPTTGYTVSGTTLTFNGAPVVGSNNIVVIFHATNVVSYDVIDSSTILSSAITTNKIADGAITTDKIAANAITSDKIAAGAIVATDISDSIVTVDKMADASVNTQKLVAYTVTSAKMSNTGVTAATYGGGSSSSVVVPVITVDNAGRLTSAANATLSLNNFDGITANTVNASSINVTSINVTTSLGSTLIPVPNVTANIIQTNVVRQSKANVSIVDNGITLDISAYSTFYIKLNSSVSSVNIANAAAANVSTVFVIQIEGDGTARTFAWPGSFKWPTNNSAPSLSSTNGKIDTFVVMNHDGGTRFFPFIAGQNS